MSPIFVRGSVALGAIAAGALAVSGLPGGSVTHATAVPAPSLVEQPSPGNGAQTAVFAGGCFWGMQLVFEHVKGVERVTAGYAGGDASTATYEQVETGTTGHAESVRVTYDPARVTYGQLLQVYFGVAHDPTEKNRQGPDVGTQYRSAIFYASEAQKTAAEAYIAQLERDKVFPRPIVTQVVPLHGFYPAEAYHQGFADRNPHNPYIVINDLPKLSAFRRTLPALYRDARAETNAS